MSKFKIAQKRVSSFSSMKNEAVLRQKQSTPNTVRLKNGQTLNANQQPQSYEIATQTSKLAQKGLASEPTNPNETSNSMALSMLAAIGCVPVEAIKSDFNLIAHQTDLEILNNPNVIDPTTVKKKKSKKTASQMFKNSNDPFYELDNDVPQNLQLEAQNRRRTLMSPNVVTLAADLASFNANAQPNFQLKEFK